MKVTWLICDACGSNEQVDAGRAERPVQVNIGTFVLASWEHLCDSCESALTSELAEKIQSFESKRESDRQGVEGLPTKS